jgi:hypothetical protein
MKTIITLLLLQLTVPLIAMGPRYERIDDFRLTHDYKPSVFESRAKAWLGLRETEAKQREEQARTEQKRRDDAQSDYQEVIADLQSAITDYDIEKTKKCFESLTSIDRYNDFELWEKNRAQLKLYIQNALYGAAASDKTIVAQQIAAEVRAFDQERLPQNNLFLG